MIKKDYLEKITEICRELLIDKNLEMDEDQENSYVVKFPEKILANAYKAFKIPKNDQIIAIIDTSIQANGKEGYVLTESGFYSKLLRSIDYVDWDQFKNENIMISKNDSIVFVKNGFYLMIESKQAQDNMMDFLQRIQEVLGKESTNLVEQIAFEDLHLEIDEGFIHAMCGKSLKGVHYTHIDGITPKRLEVIKECFPKAYDDIIYGIYDWTLFNTSKVGLVLGTNGMYWRNSPVKSESLLLWKHFSQVNFKINIEDNIYFEPQRLLGEVLCRSELLPLLEDIKLYVQSLSISNSPICYKYDPSYDKVWNIPIAKSDDEKWMLCENGMPLFPLETNEICWLIETNQLDYSKLFVWKPKMNEWTDVIKMEEFHSSIQKLIYG